MNLEKVNELEATICRDYRNIAGMVVFRDGHNVYECYFNECSADSRIHVYSVSKSIVSLLVGIAVDKGYIKGIDHKVLDFFPEYKVKKGEQTISHVTLKDLLTMTAPYKYKFEPFTYMRYFMSDDWVTFSLNLLGGRGNIGEFRYTPLVGPDILSGILMKATGQSLFDFAADNLFSPLKIIIENNVSFQTAKEQSSFNKTTTISGWAADKKGVNAGGWGLTLSPLDMAKIGQLCLNYGMWEDKQIVSAEWIKESTKAHSYWSKAALPFGYLWWIIGDNMRSCAAMGDGGNIIYCNYENRLVVSIASLFMQNPKDRIEFIKNDIEPAFHI